MIRIFIFLVVSFATVQTTRCMQAAPVHVSLAVAAEFGQLLGLPKLPLVPMPKQALPLTALFPPLILPKKAKAPEQNEAKEAGNSNSAKKE